jgi:hypothetical protein
MKMKTYWITFITLLALIIGLNITVDPANRWHPPKLTLENNWSSDQYVQSPLNFDERLFRRQQLEYISDIDVLVLGDSRAMTVSSEMLPPHRLFNAAVSSATLDDILATWEITKEKLKPKLILFYLHPDELSSTDFEARSLSNFSYIEQFLRRHINDSEIRSYWIELIVRNITRIQDDFKELVNWTTFRTSLSMLAAKDDESNSWTIVKKDQRDPKKHAWRNDGSLIYRDTVYDKSEKQIEDDATAEGSSNAIGLNHWKFDPAKSALMEKLIEEVHQAGSQIILILPPMHPLAMESLKGREQVYNSLKESLKETQTIADKSGSFFCDLSDPKAAECTSKDFFDKFHFRPDCSEKVVNKCLSLAKQKIKLN